MKAQKDTVLFDGKEWFTFVTRNMSFWHQCLSSHGIYNFLIDFGIETHVHQLAITLDGTHTVVFSYQPKYKEESQAIMTAWIRDDGPEKFEHLYKKFSGSLLDALTCANNSLTKETWQKFQFEYSRFCGALQCTAVFGRIGLETLQNRLVELDIPNEQVPNIISILSYPREHTPLFNSQIDLYRIASKRLELEEENIELKKWLKKYSHIPVNFCDEPWNISDAWEQLRTVKLNNPASQLLKFKKDHKDKIKATDELFQKINDKEVTRLGRALAEATYLNEFRKEIFSRVSLEYRSLFSIIAKRGGSKNWRDCFYLTPKEMTDLVDGKKLSIGAIVASRSVVGFCVVDNSGYHLLKIKDTKKFTRFIQSIHGEKDNRNIVTADISEILGFSANRGIVRGSVKIVLSFKDFSKVKSGDILVTTMTSVDFVSVMGRAVAFVTNEGGITSHASIVAREMDKPCIIGTKIATKVLKDGDLVEVNANEGIVKIIKRK